MKMNHMGIAALLISSMSIARKGDPLDEIFDEVLDDNYNDMFGKGKVQKYKFEKPDNPIFSPDEITHMKSLSGKKKKAYVEELREKYKRENELQNGN